MPEGESRFRASRGAALRRATSQLHNAHGCIARGAISCRMARAGARTRARPLSTCAPAATAEAMRAGISTQQEQHRANARPRDGKEDGMSRLSRRSLLRGSVGLAAVSTIGRPSVANAGGKTASVWWVQGFVKEEDASF